MIRDLLGLFFSITTSLSGSGATPAVAPLTQTCLDSFTAQNGILAQQSAPHTLSRIRAPLKDDFVAGQGWDLPQCAGLGSCDAHPAESDYVLVAENVQMNPVIFKNAFTHEQFPSDRQMIRYRPDATVSNDPTTQAQVRGRLYRTFCGDWCALNISYRGSFHCDFLFALQEKNESGAPQINAEGNPISPNPHDPNLPKNGSVFSVYFRRNAPVPELVRCDPVPTTPVEAWHQRLFREDEAYAQETRSLIWPPKDGGEWAFLRDGEVKNLEVNPDVVPWRDPVSGASTLVNPAGFPGEFEVYRHLSYPTSDTTLYLVPAGVFAQAMDALNRPTPPQPPFPTPTVIHTPPIVVIPFKEFGPMNVRRPKDAKSLQLGTFDLPKSITWIKKWYEESKPAIYLYPEKDTVMSVRLHPAGHLTLSDPLYDPETGWKNFIAHPNGTLTYNGTTYPYLYYEAALQGFSIPDEGFIVEGKHLVPFFQSTLRNLGLNTKETADFIEYWMGRLDTDQPYYFIHFLSRDIIETIEPMTISHMPDTQIRIRPYFRPISAPISIKPQTFSAPPLRRGFTLVEWGGILDTSTE